MRLPRQNREKSRRWNAAAPLGWGAGVPVAAPAPHRHESVGGSSRLRETRIDDFSRASASGSEGTPVAL